MPILFRPPDSKEVLPQSSLGLIVGVPFSSALAALAFLLLPFAAPSLLLLRPAGASPALALLRAYRTGYWLNAAAFMLTPCLFVGLAGLRFFLAKRKLDLHTVRLSVSPFLWLCGLFFCFLTVCAWHAVPYFSGLLRQYDAEIQQIESGALEHMTLLLEDASIPGCMPGAPSDEAVLRLRKALGPDSDWQWITLRFPDALDFTPASAPVIGNSRAWNWAHVQQYEVYFTANFRLVEAIVPVSQELEGF